MKRVILFFVLGCLILFSIIQFARARVSHDLAQPVAESVLSPTPTTVLNKNNTQEMKTSVFVPYWALGADEVLSNEYDQYIYFGITPNATSIEQEDGSANIERFAAAVPSGKTSLLTLRMVDSETNAAILKDKTAQKRIITQTISYAKQNGFSGVILDLEMSAIPFDSLIQQISAFNKDLSSEVKQSDLKYGLTLYGDTFYRIRPFDVKTLSQNADMVLLMAYDFHKSRANPGPNFPLNGQEEYGYDMAKMIDDTLRFVPAKNVSVIFGMFGYDWVVDGQGKAIEHGDPLTYDQIKEKFLTTCDFTDCRITRDKKSAETKITYTDEDNKKHVVWYEDPKSVAAKQDYLRQRGITSSSFWAYSYF